MPILYVCMINERKAVISEALGTGTKGDFKSQVLKYHQQFEKYARKFYGITAEIHLSYRD